MPESERTGPSGGVLVESERLLVRRPGKDDRRLLQRVFCDPEMMRYLGGPWTPDKAADALDEWHDGWGVDRRWYGVLARRDTSEPVGAAGVMDDAIPGEAGPELSWFVLPEHQGQGFATEISRGLLRFAYEDLGVDRVVSETHPDNPASNRVLEKLGFVCLGERHHDYDFLPGFGTQVLWELTRERWRAETP